MASFHNAMFCALAATALWTCFGLSLSLHLMPRSLAWPAAPALGWAAHSAAVFPIFCLIGLTKVTVIVVTGLALLGTLVAISLRVRSVDNGPVTPTVPLWAVGCAAVLAFAIMLMLLPQSGPGGVTFADAIFDHSKVAMIDEMARLGVPAGNPFFGESDGLNRLSYYYLWHFSAAELVLLTGLTGWEADAGLTWFTAFSSLLLMMGFANLLSLRRAAAGWVLIFGMVYSIRPVLSQLFGRELTYAITGWPGGFGAWLFQVTWAPQHVASACGVVIAIFLLVELSRKQGALISISLALVVAASFESSTWVGGVTFPLAAITVGLMVLLRVDVDNRKRFILCTVGAGVLSMALASLFIFDQVRASALRADGSPVGIFPYEILGDETPEYLRNFLDVPIYWTAFLFTEFAAFYPTGIFMMIWLANDRLLPQLQRTYVTPYGILTLISLGVGSMLVSRLGGNNDLAWRGVLPAVLVLIIFSAAGLSRYLRSMQYLFAASAVALIGLGSFSGMRNICYNICGQSKEPTLLFAESAGMWEAVRKQTGNDERIANNPLFLSDMTRWPINISWALMANRRSCYASNGFGPFAPRTKMSREDIDAQFDRVFSGHPHPGDVDQLAKQYDCTVVVITPQDGAWKSDPFASTTTYRIVDNKADFWRIYRRN